MNAPDTSKWLVYIKENDELIMENNDKDCCRTFLKPDVFANLIDVNQYILPATCSVGDRLENDMPFWVCNSLKNAKAIGDQLAPDSYEIQEFPNLWELCKDDGELFHTYLDYFSPKQKRKWNQDREVQLSNLVN